VHGGRWTQAARVVDGRVNVRLCLASSCFCLLVRVSWQRMQFPCLSDRQVQESAEALVRYGGKINEHFIVLC